MFTPELADKLVKLLVVRGDAYAKQFSDGTYVNPVRNNSGMILPWKRELLYEHLDGLATYGHFAMRGDQAKYFCFDLDFRKLAKIDVLPDLTNMPERPKAADEWLALNSQSMYINPREIFAENPDNEWLRWQLRTVTELFVHQITDVLGIASLASFSGNKGIHVYGFPTPGRSMDAAVLRKLARNVMENMGHYWVKKNDSGTFWYGSDVDPCLSLFDVEIFPKQDYVEPDKFGNLMRMELGVHQKSGKPGYFIDLDQPVLDILPMLPEQALGGLV